MATELIKFANAQASFITEAMLDHTDEQGRVWNKLVLVLVKRTREDKAELTLRYFLDVPVAKVLCHDLWAGELDTEYSEYKRLANKERALKIEPTEKGYRLHLGYRENGGDWQRLFFDVTDFQARQLAITVLDYFRAYELAAFINVATEPPRENKEWTNN